MIRALFFLLFLTTAVACHSSRQGTKVVKPKTHKVWPAGNRYLIDIPVGARHIRLFKRRTTKIERLK